MKFDGAVIKEAARLFLPLAFLFALSLLATRAPGQGAGLIAGLGFALALMLHALIFGAGAARRAFPGVAARGALAGGVVLAALGAGFTHAPLAAEIAELGLFLAIVGAFGLVFAVLIGRAPTLREEDAP